MVVIEHLFHPFQVKIVLGELLPGQVDHQLQVVQLDGILRHLGVHTPQLG